MELREIVGHGHSSRYALKDEILSRNIYGVDIMPMAVEIARLRAWLSLVLESDFKPKDRTHNFGIKALPNLDFKFVCANTLVDSGYDSFLNKVEQSLNATLMRLDGAIQRLERLRDSYYDPKGDKHRKQELKAEFYATKDHIKNDFKGLAKNWGLNDFLSNVDQWDPFDDSRPSPFYSSGWMFGMRTGFDVVIGNPPYVQLQKMPAAAKAALAKQGYATYEPTGDIYQLFYERGFKLLRPDGVLAYITSNKWMRTNYGHSTRQYFTDRTVPRIVVDFGMAQMFSSATTYTNILIARKASGQQPELPMCRMGNDFKDPSELAPYIAAHTALVQHPKAMPWVAYLPDEYGLIQRIEAQGIPLEKWDVSINYGIKTGYNPAFIIDGAKRAELIAADAKSAEVIRPLLRGEDVKDFVPAFDDQYIIALFPSKHYNIDDFKGIKKYLSAMRERIEPKPRNHDPKKEWKGRKAGSYKWFETQDSISYHEDFDKPKVIYPNMTKFLPFAYDESDGYMCNDKAFILTGKHVKYLVGVLNSKLWKFAFKDRFPELLGDAKEVRKVFFEKVPVMLPKGDYEKSVSALVDDIIALKKTNSSTDAAIAELNAVVYRMYGLNEEEVRMVEGSSM